MGFQMKGAWLDQLTKAIQLKHSTCTRTVNICHSCVTEMSSRSWLESLLLFICCSTRWPVYHNGEVGKLRILCGMQPVGTYVLRSATEDMQLKLLDLQANYDLKKCKSILLLEFYVSLSEAAYPHLRRLHGTIFVLSENKQVSSVVKKCWT